MAFNGYVRVLEQRNAEGGGKSLLRGQYKEAMEGQSEDDAHSLRAAAVQEISRLTSLGEHRTVHPT